MDAIIYIGSTQLLIDKFKYWMMNRFKITNVGLLHYFLSLEVKQGENDERNYTEDLLKCFNM